MDEIEKVKEIIEKAGLTRDEAARRLGVSSKSLGNWLNGKSSPRKKNIEIIRKVYRELFGRRNGKDSDVVVRRKLSDILLTTKKEAIARDLGDDESAARKIYYDGKVIAWTLEKQNRDKLILFPSICKNKGEWYKMGGNSALFYTYYVAPRLKRKPIIRKDSDIKYRFSKGLVMVHWIDRFIECVEGLGLKAVKGEYGIVMVGLEQTFTVVEIKEMSERARNDNKRFRDMIMPKENFPDMYGLLRRLAQMIIPKIKKMDGAYRGVFGERMIEIVMDLYATYFRVTDGLITKQEGRLNIRGLLQDLSGLILLADEVEWFDFAYRTKIGETIVELKAAVERRLNAESQN